MATGEYCINPGFTADGQEEIKDVATQTECPQTIADIDNDKNAEECLDSGDVKNTETDSRNPLRALTVSSRCGLIFSALTAFLFSVKNIFVYHLTATINSSQSAAMVMLAAMFSSLVVLVLRKIPPPKTVQHYTWLFAGGLALSMSFSSFTVAVTFINVADAITISYSSLAFVGVLSWIILREKLYLFDFVFALISLSGVVFIARPPFIFGTAEDDTDDNSNDLSIGVGIAMLMAFFSGLSYPLMRRQSQLGIHAFISAFCVATMGALINSIICTAFMRWRVPAWDELLFALGAGLSYSLAAATTVISLSIETATLFNIVLSLEIAFTFLLQFVVLRVFPHWTSDIGASLVVAACIGIGLKNRRVE